MNLLNKTSILILKNMMIHKEMKKSICKYVKTNFKLQKNRKKANKLYKKKFSKNLTMILIIQIVISQIKNFNFKLWMNLK